MFTDRHIHLAALDTQPPQFPWRPRYRCYAAVPRAVAVGVLFWTACEAAAVGRWVLYLVLYVLGVAVLGGWKW